MAKKQKDHQVPDLIKAYIDKKNDQIKEAILLRENEIIASQAQQIMNMELEVRNLFFEYMPKIQKFLDILEQIKNIHTEPYYKG